MLSKKCLKCGKVFYRPNYCSYKNWKEKRKYCSKECADVYKIGMSVHTEKHKRELAKKMKGNKYTLGMPSWNKGKKNIFSEKVLEEMKIRATGINSPVWKGERAGHRAIHQWVERQKGKASEHKCKHCNGEARHWSNVDHKYRRNIDDYEALCQKCHWKHHRDAKLI